MYSWVKCSRDGSSARSKVAWKASPDSPSIFGPWMQVCFCVTQSCETQMQCVCDLFPTLPFAQFAHAYCNRQWKEHLEHWAPRWGWGDDTIWWALHANDLKGMQGAPCAWGLHDSLPSSLTIQAVIDLTECLHRILYKYISIYKCYVSLYMFTLKICLHWKSLKSMIILCSFSALRLWHTFLPSTHPQWHWHPRRGPQYRFESMITPSNEPKQSINTEWKHECRWMLWMPMNA